MKHEIIIGLIVFACVFGVAIWGSWYTSKKRDEHGWKVRRWLFKIMLFVCICVAGVILCFGVFFLFDDVWNGAFLDWFDSNFMQYDEYYTDGTYLYEGYDDMSKSTSTDGEVEYDSNYISVPAIVASWHPNWFKVKLLLLIISISVVLLCIIIVFVVSSIHARKKSKYIITQLSQLLRSYMTGDKEATAVFPTEYAEVSVQMTEIKSTIISHEQALREESARKNDLVTYLAHDLKTPLTSIIGYLSLLEEAPDMPVEQKSKYVHIALDKAYRLEKLVNEFFEIARYNLQQIHLDKENIDLYYMLVQLVDEFYPILSTNGNTATLSGNENLTVYGDPAKLARVFNNILKNAAAYSYSDSEIVITAEEKNEHIVVEFQNRGATIPADKLSIIFEKFYRMDDARTTDKGGAGLGLAIAKEIVDLHGGTITARSIDNVTTFTVTLPIPEIS